MKEVRGTEQSSVSAKDRNLERNYHIIFSLCLEVSPNFKDSRLNAYFADGWNQIDAFVVFVSVFSLALPSYKSLRAWRAIRPLRLAIRFEEVSLPFVGY